MLKYEIIDNHADEWVVFIHGIGGSTKTWKKQIDSFSKNYNLLLLDLPGHGQNAENSIYKVDSQKLHAGIQETMDHLHIDRAHFVGLSLGTIVIANLAIHCPDRVDAIIFGGSVLKLSGFYKRALIFANRVKRIVPYEFLYTFFAWFMMPKKRHKKSRSIFLREVVKLRKETLFAWIEYLMWALNPDKALAKLDFLGKRILLISGGEDHCFLKDAKSIAQKMKSTEIKIIDKCGHICSIESWNTFNRIALEYLSAYKTEKGIVSL